MMMDLNWRPRAGCLLHKLNWRGKNHPLVRNLAHFFEINKKKMKIGRSVLWKHFNFAERNNWLPDHEMLQFKWQTIRNSLNFILSYWNLILYLKKQIKYREYSSVLWFRCFRIHVINANYFKLIDFIAGNAIVWRGRIQIR